MKKLYIGILGVLTLGGIALSGSSSTPATATYSPVVSPVTQVAPVERVVEKTVAPAPSPSVTKTETVKTTSTLSNDTYYTNSAGNEVHSPAYSESVPVGASARCKDGTYSFSQSKRGTCSHHGGVAEWI